MMRKVLNVLSIASFCIAMFLLIKYFSPTGKTVFINIPKLLGSYKGTIAAKKEFEDKSKMYPPEQLHI